VYVLVGDDPSIPGRLAVYVGEGDDVFRRLVGHDKDQSKDFWDRAAMFVSKDANLTKAHVRYLESRLITAGKAARRATIVNQNHPEGGSLPEADIAEMDDFLDQVRLLLATLGINVFEPSSAHTGTTIAPADGDGVLGFEFEGDGYHASCRIVDGEFVVAKGSVARLAEAHSLSESSKAVRAELRSSGVLVDQGTGLEFAQDYAFASASGAAQVVNGANVNGRICWKLPDGTTYKDWQERELDGVDDSAGEDA
jgi:hypothetical protein